MRTLRFIAAMASIQLRAAMEYRASFLAQVVFMMLNDLFLLFFWWVVFGKFGSVGDWRMQDMLLLYAVGTTAFGLAVGLFGNVTTLATQIAQGKLDSVLSMPPDPMLHLLVSGMNVSAWGDLLFGLLLYGMVGDTSLAGLALFAVVSILSAAVFLGFSVAAASLAFFVGSAEGLAGLMTNAILTFSLYPPGIFSGWTRVVLFTAIPAGLMTYLPVALLREFSIGGFLLLVLGAAASLAAGRILFQVGLRRYESGSLMVARGA
ncbi:MAG: ABC-2 family transporter protein [Candidatus Riflebacteria bacterium]|nr:ABC-2 family transporter protein [Candidatus Riflebacteria bacterium]